MLSHIDFRVKRLFAYRAIFASLLLLSAGQPLSAQTAKEEMAPQVAAEPMDDDWHNDVSTKALLSELTRLALDLEKQRKENANLAAKVDRLTQRLDGMQAQLVSAGYPAVPVGAPEAVANGGEAKPAQPTPPLPVGPVVGEVKAPESLLKQKAAKGEVVETAPLTPLEAGDANRAKPEKKAAQDEGYFSYVWKKGDELITRITDW
nr:hypothetical protein [uncultured Cohaesibacter sp.]